MGNCLRQHVHELEVHWGGEDWTSALMSKEEKPEAMISKPENTWRSTTTSSVEVKIKITKKQLDKYLTQLHDNQLLQEQGLSVHQALAQLVKLSDARPGWRPTLHTIPEV